MWTSCGGSVSLCSVLDCVCAQIERDVRVQPPVTTVAHWPFAWHWRPMLPDHPGAQYAPCTKVPAVTPDGHTAL